MTRPGWHSEQVRNQAFREVLADTDYLKKQHRIILLAIENYNLPGMIMREISDQTGIPVHTVSARLNELRVLGWLVTNENDKRLNIHSGKMNTVWKLNEMKFKEQLKLF